VVIKQRIKPSPVVPAKTLNNGIVSAVVKDSASVVRDSLKLQ
jgi:hypothetical protein